MTKLALGGIICYAAGCAAMLAPLIGMMLGLRWAATNHPAFGQLIPTWFPYATIIAVSVLGLLVIAGFSLYIVLNPPETWPETRTKTE